MKRTIFFLLALILPAISPASDNALVMVLLGPPVSGKSTQSKYINEIRPLPHISTGDLLREHKRNGTELGTLAETYMSAGLLVPDEIVLKMLRERLSQPDCSNGFLLDGFPRTKAQAISLEKFLDESADFKVVNLDVSDEEVTRRLAGRGGNRSDDKPEIFKKRLKIFHEQNDALVEFYEKKGVLTHVDAGGMPEEAFKQIRPLLTK